MNLDDLWTKLKATDPLVEFRTEPKMQMVVSCQRPLDMWNLTGPRLSGRSEKARADQGAQIRHL